MPPISGLFSPLVTAKPAFATSSRIWRRRFESVTVAGVNFRFGLASMPSRAAVSNASNARPVAVHQDGDTLPTWVCTLMERGLSTFER